MMNNTKNNTFEIYDFFISYASINRVPVQLLVDRLKEEGFRVWFDQEQIVAGYPTIGQLMDGIVASKHMLVCLSDAYIDRDWTQLELITNQTRDPSNKSNRTIPVKIDKLTRQLPPQISFMVYADLTDPAAYEREYEKICKAVQEAEPTLPPPNPNDRKFLEDRCKAAFDPNNNPISALLQARVAAVALCKFLYSRELRRPPADTTLDTLIRGLSTSTKLPAPIKMSLNTVQHYGTWNIESTDYDITLELVQPGLAALKVIADWTFTTYFKQDAKPDLWESILAALPPGTEPGEYLIPDTKYILKTPQLSLNSLGPLYHGRNKEWGGMVAINLVALSESAESHFNEEVAHFIRLNNSRIIRPHDAGRVVVNNRRLCLYVAIEHVDGVSGQDLVNRFEFLPALAACELCMGVAFALISFHTSQQPIVHGDIKPANIFVDMYGQVKVLCIGRNTRLTAEDTISGAAQGKIDSFLFASPEQRAGVEKLSSQTDLYALRAMLFYLLTGEYEANVNTDELRAVLPIVAQRALDELKTCNTAEKAAEILEHACHQLTGYSLRFVTDAFRKNAALPPEPELPSGILSMPLTQVGPSMVGSSPEVESPGFYLRQEFAIESRRAWALGNGRILAWEANAGTLAVLDGGELIWRDEFTIPIRHIVRGNGTHLAVTSWEGHVRLFADGKIMLATRLQGGTIGDIQFCNGSWIAGTWQGPLYALTPPHPIKFLTPTIDKGTFRIAVMKDKDTFAVADLSGGIRFYTNHICTATIPPLGLISSMAFSGQQLMILANKILTPISRDGHVGSPSHQPSHDKAYLHPSLYEPGCLFITEKGNSWIIDQAGRYLPYINFPPGTRLHSTCHYPKRYTLALPNGGYAYYGKDGQLQETWSEALDAQLSLDGHYLAVTLPTKALLYEDTRGKYE